MRASYPYAHTIRASPHFPFHAPRANHAMHRFPAVPAPTATLRFCTPPRHGAQSVTVTAEKRLRGNPTIRELYSAQVHYDLAPRDHEP